ncbi:P-loop NTPase fold protein [Salinispora cortesiana]|uniref:P-loop NTPase fold protein n=1 Tax=Salinispora cortesiana TaxID=1305843 RepID=UPI0012BB7878|nr:P-loop NTPase fold protein [Salinispora cortesiana]
MGAETVRVVQWLTVNAMSAVDLAVDLRRQWRAGRAKRFAEEAVRNALSRTEFAHFLSVHPAREFVWGHVTRRAHVGIIEYVKLREMWRSRLVAYSLGLLVAMITMKNIPPVPNELQQRTREAVAQLGTTGMAAVMLATVIVMGSMIVGLGITAWAAFLRYRIALRQACDSLLPHVRIAINIWTERHSPDVLLFDEAPALGARAGSGYYIDRVEQERISTLIRELGVSAVAVSGPRGAGKSTLLHAIAADADARGDSCLSLEAPATYEARDFVIALHRQLCVHVTQRVSAVRDSRWRRAMNRLITAVQGIGLLTAGYLAALQWEVTAAELPQHLTDSHPPINSWQAGAFIAALVVITISIGALRPPQGLPGAADLLQRAVQDEQKLRFLQSVSTEHSAGLKAKIGFELGRKHTRQLLEHAASLPDLVRSYQQFANMFVTWWRRHAGTDKNLIIVIDELDRVTDAEAAERFINDIKGIFGLNHCTYLLTVSEDALAQFERRMIGIRPVIDSTFDEVVRLPVLQIDQSEDLLARRLVGVPTAFIALCHCLSGGIPRDLIRSARALIDSRRSLQEDHLTPLAHELVHQEIQRLKSGLISRVHTELNGAAAVRHLQLLADPDWPQRDPTALLIAARKLLPPHEDAVIDDRIAMEIGVALFYYGTILQVFLPYTTVDLMEVAERLAVARSVMPTSVELAYVHISRLRKQAGLDTSPGEPRR